MTFRSRLLISHVVPVVLLVPLVGLALIYLLETRLILPVLANEMIDQGVLVERLTQDRPGLWTSPVDAQNLLNSMDFHRPTRIGLLNPDRILLATSRPEDRALVGETIPNLPDPASLVDPWYAITPGAQPDEQILDVVIPVKQTGGQTVGLIRIYRRIADIEQVFFEMRLLILGVLLFGLVITVALAVILSESISRPLRKFTRTISESPLEGHAPLLPENGKDELSELSRAYNRLQERREELEGNRQQMMANLVHEIGRPLGSLRTAVHALLAGAVNDRLLSNELLNGMSERIDRMGRLLEDLALAYRRLGPQEIHVKSIQLIEWVNSLTPLWAENALQKQLLWETILPEDQPTIQTDPDRLAQALSNLVSNAIKFTPAGGKITLAVHLELEKIHFLVSDNGIGILPQDQSRLFVPFFRSIQPSWKSPGLGLGLSITKSIVDSLGGQITFSSVPDQGSTFAITLPIQ
jgi:two-component system, OmpR family, sensor histidine kinase BaeS